MQPITGWQASVVQLSLSSQSTGPWDSHAASRHSPTRHASPASQAAPSVVTTSQPSSSPVAFESLHHAIA
jgi:hypothetical protein